MTPKVGPITAIIRESICVQGVPSVSCTPVPKGRVEEPPPSPPGARG